MPTPFDNIAKADMDALATLAGSKCEPQDYTVSDADVGGTLTGSFSFPAEASTTTKRAWGDELERIWCSLFDKDQSTVSPFEYSATTANYGNFSCDRINDVLDNWFDYVERGNLPKTVFSCGPHLYIDTKPGLVPQQDDIAVRACNNVEFIFSRMDAEPFTLRTGFVLGTIEYPYEAGIDGGLGTSASPAFVNFDYDLPGGHLYGDVYFTWTAPTSGSTPPGTSDIGFSGWGTGASGQWEHMGGTQWRFHLGSTGIKSLIDNSGSPASGTLQFSNYVNDTGWSCTGFVMIGVIQFSEVTSSADATDTTYSVIHPRNAAMRSAFHITSDVLFAARATGIVDIIEFDDFVLKIQAGGPPDPPTADDVSQFIYDSIDSTLRSQIDAYVSGANDAIYDGLITFLNDKIEGTNLYDTGAWSGVTLRESTQWLLDLDPQDGELLKILNRLLWEDAYPAELRRIPATDFEPTEEVAQLVVGNLDWFTSTNSVRGYYFSDFCAGTFMTIDSDTSLSPVGRATGIYVAEAWPQPFFNTVIDQDLPQYYETANDDGSALRNAEYVYDSQGNEVGLVQPAARNTMATWPVVKASYFGSASFSDTLTPSGKAYAAMQSRVGYWDADQHHVWNDVGYTTLAADAVGNYSFSIPSTGGNALLEKMRLEVSAGNRNVTVYVGTDVPDPNDSGTYLFSRADGRFTFPDDFVAETLDPADYYGTPIFYTFKNTGSSSQSLHIETSLFYSLAGEDPPLPEPLFFPRYDRLESGRYRMALERDSASLLSDQSYRFTPFHSTSTWGDERAMPVPDRGYCVVGLIIRKKPVQNSSGIYIESSGLSQVQVGIMAGTGVVAGAETGVYPGEFIQFGSYSVDGPELIQEVFWPVLEGCPLAFRDVTGEHVVVAYVNFQPGVNVEFTPYTIGTAAQQGTYSGKAYLQPHYLFGGNYNASTEIPDGRHIPPISERCYRDLYNCLTLQP